jgi:hypothetical protein
MATGHMEPFDFDKLIKEKVEEQGNLHSQSAEQARHGIWMNIQEDIKGRKFISWYHLAASIAFLLISFSIVLILVQKRYLNENQELLTKMENLQKEYVIGMNALSEKEKEITGLKTNVDLLEGQLSELEVNNSQQPELPVSTVIYKTDTVYVRTIEYVAYTPEEPVLEEHSTLEEPESGSQGETVETSREQ